MVKKEKSILLLVVLLLLFSLACNFPTAGSVPGQKIFCLLTGGKWIEYVDPEYGLVEWQCVKNPPREVVDPTATVIPADSDPVEMQETMSPLETAAPSIEEPTAPPPLVSDETPNESLEDRIPGVWTGTWKIQDEYNPPWDTIFTFNADGTFTATFSSSLGTLDYFGNWSLVEDKIHLNVLSPWNFVWTGSVIEKTEIFMSGTDDSMNAVWSLTKQE